MNKEKQISKMENVKKALPVKTKVEKEPKDRKETKIIENERKKIKEETPEAKFEDLFSMKGAEQLDDCYLLDVNKIETELQIRKSEDKEKIEELTDSINKRATKKDGSLDPKRGLINPITADYLEKSGKLTLTTGYNRLKAYRKLKLTKIPCRINLVKEERDYINVIVDQYHENVKRHGLKAIEEIYAVKQLKNNGLKQVEIANRLGKSETVVSKSIKIINIIEKLPEDLKSLATSQDLNYSQIEELTRLKDPKLIEKYIKNPSTVKEMRGGKEDSHEIRAISEKKDQKVDNPCIFKISTPLDYSFGTSKIHLSIIFPNAEWNYDHVIKVIKSMTTYIKKKFIEGNSDGKSR